MLKIVSDLRVRLSEDPSTTSSAGVSFGNASCFYCKQTDNCFIMKELRLTFPLKFLNV